MYKYSPTTGGFYTQAFHGSAIPSDVVDVSVSEHTELMAAQDIGKRIQPGADGAPLALNPPVPTPDQLATHARRKRAELLSASDWTQARDIQEATTELWVPYRQALRDVPAQAGFPQLIDWPAEPGAQ